MPTKMQNRGYLDVFYVTDDDLAANDDCLCCSACGNDMDEGDAYVERPDTTTMPGHKLLEWIDIGCAVVEGWRLHYDDEPARSVSLPEPQEPPK